MNRLLPFLAILCIGMGCKSSQPSASSQQVSALDYPKLRPLPPATKPEPAKPQTTTSSSKGPQMLPQGRVNAQLLARLLSTQAEGQVEVYRLQLYNGNSREKAEQALSTARNIYGAQHISMKYDQPNYKAKVGFFFNQLEAYQAQGLLKADFPGAIIISERIKVEELEKQLR